MCTTTRRLVDSKEYKLNDVQAEADYYQIIEIQKTKKESFKQQKRISLPWR